MLPLLSSFNSLIAGFGISKSSIENIASNFQSLIDTINSGEGDIYPDDPFGEMLHSVGAVYFYELDAMYKLTANLLKIRTLRHPSVAITSTSLNVTYILYIPTKVEVTGLNIDNDRDLESAHSLNGDIKNVVTYAIQTGTIGSMMEHMIYENLFQQEGMSTVKILQIANQEGIPIYQITQDNISQILPNLQIGSSIKTAIQNFANAGYTVTVPKQNISYNGWSGTGYIALDPSTGNAAYMIEGLSAGGDTTGWWELGAASATLLAIAEILKHGETIPVSKLLGTFAVIASVLGIAVDTLDNLSKIQEAKLSPETKEMLSGLVIGIGVALAALVFIGISFGAIGIAVTVLITYYLSMIFHYVIPDIILTAERIENR